MNRNPLVIVFLSFLLLSPTVKSFAQDSSNDYNNDMDEQAREDQTRETLNQIHDLESKMQDNARRLDALEKAVNQADEAAPMNVNQEAPVAEVKQTASASVIVPVKASVPQEFPRASSRRINEINAEPVDVLPAAPIYYAPQAGFPKEHTFELAQEDFYNAYKEPDEKRRGGAYGFYSAYAYRPLGGEFWPINVFHVDVHGDYSRVKYDMDDVNLRGVNNYTVEPRVWVGKDFNFDSNVVTPYIGGGYRWYYEELKNKLGLSADIDGLNFSATSNNVQTQYIYIPLGAQMSLHTIPGWRVDMNAEYDLLVWGRVTTYAPHFSVNGVDISSPAVNNTLRNGYGLRGSIKFLKEGDSFNYFVEPYIRYWNIRHSNTVSDPFSIDGIYLTSVPAQQDKNTATEVGARVGVEF